MKKEILLGNEAIVQGALEAGVDFVSAYPGTPSSEIGDIFGKIAEKHGIYFEFSTNEKVALEAAIGASFSGLKCLVSMKHFGVNVAVEALNPFAYTGAKGATVILVADDPSCWSSGQSEQNTRAYAYLSHVPVLEPSDAQEAKDFIKEAFEISERFKIPVIVRTTTRVAHQRMPVEIGRVASKKPAKKGKFVKDFNQFVTMPPRVLEMKEELLDKMKKIQEMAEKSKLNFSESSGNGKIGIITSGISYLHVKEAMKRIGLEAPVLKIGFFYPLPAKKIKDFVKSLDKVLIVEELEPFLEKEVKIIAKNLKVEVTGKDLLPVTGELSPEKAEKALAEFSGKKYSSPKEKKLDLPIRFPRLCPGCPYWLVFSAVKKSAPKGAIYGGDIGCYMLAGFPPHNLQDYLLCMGSSVGIGHGIGKSTNQKVIAFIGDSTFFHAGIPALVNSVFNKSDPLIIVMDNRITAMTGHQPNPGMGKTGMGEATEEIEIEKVAKACGVKNTRTIDPSQIEELQKTIKNFAKKKTASVIVVKRPCIQI